MFRSKICKITLNKNLDLRGYLSPIRFPRTKCLFTDKYNKADKEALCDIIGVFCVLFDLLRFLRLNWVDKVQQNFCSCLTIQLLLLSTERFT